MGTSIPYSPGKLADAAAGGKTGTTHRGGSNFRTRRLSDTTIPTKTQEDCREDYLSLERIWAFLMPLRVEHVSGLNVGVCPGYYRKADETDVYFAGAASFALTDGVTDQKVWIDHATNALAKGTSWPADKTGFTPLALVDTAGGTVVAESIRDATDLVRLQAHASSTSPTGTNGTAFTLDADNAGAGADQQIRFNRGSTDAEDAAVEWDETNDRLNALKQHATKTLCPLNASALQIGGTTLVDAAGAAKVTAAVAGEGLTHSAGVLAVNPDGSTLEINTDQVRVKDGGVTAAKLSDALADKLAQVSISDASGASPRTVTVQILDVQGNSLAEVVVLQVGVYQDEYGAATATNATIAVGATGTLIKAVTANKELICRTDSAGALTLTITDATLETVYVLARATVRSKLLDCSDKGTVTIS